MCDAVLIVERYAIDNGDALQTLIFISIFLANKNEVIWVGKIECQRAVLVTVSTFKARTDTIRRGTYGRYLTAVDDNVATRSRTEWPALRSYFTVAFLNPSFPASISSSSVSPCF